jgi:UDP-N-acetylglucosamine 2-epimerase (non-hydrolysing)
MKFLTVVGARPNFMKAASIIAAIQKHNAEVARGGAGRAIDHVLVHTGQHYDAAMSGSFFSDLNLPEPDIRLGVGSGSHAVQTATVLKNFEEVLLNQKPDAVIVVGDVNSTLACALATVKIAFDAQGRRPLLAHVEAGLRSFDRLMPEEVNRVVTDHVSDLLLVTEESGVRNLLHEGLPAESIHLVGNTMIDSLLRFQDKAEDSDVLDRLNLRHSGSRGKETLPYALLTLHRPSNVDNRETFVRIMNGVEELTKERPVVFPVHPRTQRQIKELGIDERFCVNPGPARGAGLLVIEPLGYLDFLCLMKHALLVVTDSGGIQEETTCLGIPCVTVRENTERPVTVESGTNVIAGTVSGQIREAIRRQLGRKPPGRLPDRWDGKAGARIVDLLTNAVSRGGVGVQPNFASGLKAEGAVP